MMILSRCLIRRCSRFWCLCLGVCVCVCLFRLFIEPSVCVTAYTLTSLSSSAHRSFRAPHIIWFELCDFGRCDCNAADTRCRILFLSWNSNEEKVVIQTSTVHTYTFHSNLRSHALPTIRFYVIKACRPLDISIPLCVIDIISSDYFNLIFNISIVAIR